MSDLSNDFDDSLDSLDGDSSMVPLIDVLFAVLASLMFALTAANFEGALDLELPRVETEPSNPTENWTVELASDGRVLLHGEEVALEDLTARLDRLLAQERRSVNLRADRSANFEDGARILAAIRASRAGGASITTDG
ncbi:MAG: biopolymer transporter ExbD [Planctomycetota bacterium]